MIVLDLALQGILDLSGSIRVRLQSGYNAVVSPQARPETIVSGLTEVLYADKPLPRVTAAGAKAGGGVTLTAADGATFRVMRDLGAGTAQLLEFNRETKTFARIGTELPEIAQILRDRGLPDRRTFETVYLLRPGDLPSAARAKSAGADPAVLKARLAEVEKIVAEHKAVEETEFELDGLQKKRFSLEDQLKEQVFDRTELAEAEAEEKRVRYLDVLPEDIVERFERYSKAVGRRDTDLRRWSSERQGIQGAMNAVTVRPILRDWRLWTGVGVGVLSVAAAFFLSGTLRYVALADIPAFGVAAFILYQNLTQREQRERLSRRLKLFDNRRDTISSRNSGEIAAVKALLDQVSISTAEELERALAMRKQARAKVERLRDAERQSALNPHVHALRRELDEVSAHIAAMEAQLGGLSLAPADTVALMGEATKIRAELKAMGALEAEVKAGPLGPLFFAIAREALLADAETTAKSLSERASLMIRAISASKLNGIVLEPQGDIQIRTADGRTVGFREMPAAAQDLAYLALRGALFLSIEPQQRAPLVVGDLAGCMPKGVEVLQILLSSLAQAGQVVQVVRRPEQAPQAKHVVTAGAS